MLPLFICLSILLCIILVFFIVDGRKIAAAGVGGVLVICLIFTASYAVNQIHESNMSASTSVVEDGISVN